MECVLGDATTLIKISLTVDDFDKFSDVKSWFTVPRFNLSYNCSTNLLDNYDIRGTFPSLHPLA